VIIVFRYNIVGDGTPQALIPVFTGKTEVELPLTRKVHKEAQYVNVYPFIWKDYEEMGTCNTFNSYYCSKVYYRSIKFATYIIKFTTGPFEGG